MNEWIKLGDELTLAILRGDPRALAGLVVVGSILLHVLASNLAWHYRVKPEGRFAARVNRLASSPAARILFELLRLAYYVVLPGFALLSGWIDARSFGIAYVDWADGARWTIVLLLGSWSLLMFVWVPFLRATLPIPVRLNTAVLTWSRRIVEVVYMQAHWALYRAAAILILASRLNDSDSIYWGACAGFGLIVIEAWADPRVRRQVAHLGDGEIALWNASQAIINTVGFVVTRNLWYLALIHLLLEFSVPHLRPLHLAARDEASTSPAPPQTETTRGAS